MKKRKKEKLVLIAPSGEEYKIGFLRPCTDGFVLGTTQMEGESSHLTILHKEDILSAHITPQNSLKQQQYFPPVSLKETKTRLGYLIENKMIFQLSQEQLSEEVFYLTKKFQDWFDALISALFQKETSENQVTYVINFKRLFDELPNLVEQLKISPQSFFGICKAQNILSDSSIAIGISNSKSLIIPIEKELIGIDLSTFTNLEFIPSTDKPQLDSPLTEIYQSMGINQYIKQEIIDKQFFEKLLTPEKWQAEALRLETKLKKNDHTGSVL
ncbi:MAG: hypothetical protein ABSC20_09570 [Candidatus Bathyarchaeia archaeon]|jgi:hypothetical protein